MNRLILALSCAIFTAFLAACGGVASNQFAPRTGDGVSNAVAQLGIRVACSMRVAS